MQLRSRKRNSFEAKGDFPSSQPRFGSVTAHKPGPSPCAEPDSTRGRSPVQDVVIGNGMTEALVFNCSKFDDVPRQKGFGLSQSTEAEIQNLKNAGLMRPKAPFEDILTLEGVRWTKDIYWGANVARNQLFAGQGLSKVTKSCHHCQNQHIWVPCGTEDLNNVKQEQEGLLGKACQKSFCDRCIYKHFPGLTYEEACSQCPCCRTICNCKICLRKQNTKVALPEYSVGAREQMAKHVLRHLAPVIAETLKMEEAAAKCLSYCPGVEGAMLSRLDGERSLCNMCSTSISNLHGACSECEWDFCTHCLLSRATFPISCFNPDCNSTLLQAKRYFDDTEISVMREVADMACQSGPTTGEGTEAYTSQHRNDNISSLAFALAHPSTASGSLLPEEMPIEMDPSDEERSAARASCTLPRREGRVYCWGRRWIREEDIRMGTWEGVTGLMNDKSMTLENSMLWCPHADSLKPCHRDFKINIEIFLELWRDRCPVIVRGVKGRMNWTPEVMLRAVRELGNIRFASTQTEKDLDVLMCNGGEPIKLSQAAFFTRFVRQQELQFLDGAVLEDQPLLKVKDWPQDDQFSQRMVRHNQDFMEMLPFPFLTLPMGAPLNLACSMPSWSNPTDLGPKTYIAFGRVQEHEDEEGDSVTKLHQDMSDAVNILVHAQMAKGEDPPEKRKGLDLAQRSSGHGRAGAVWHIWRVDDSALVRKYLEANLSDFKNKGKQLDRSSVKDVVFDHCCMVSSRHLDRMATGSWSPSEAPQGSSASPDTMPRVFPWHFEQHQDEAVFIPGGCMHQVRNLRSCVKIAVDFVSPESLNQNQIMSQALRSCPHNLSEAPQDRFYQDKLQAGLMNMAAAVTCMRVLSPVVQPALLAHPAQQKKKKRGRAPAAEVLGCTDTASGPRKRVENKKSKKNDPFPNPPPHLRQEQASNNSGAQNISKSPSQAESSVAPLQTLLPIQSEQPAERNEAAAWPALPRRKPLAS